ncbi:MAG: hypothetical protein GXO64_01410 [Candidatus Micrarchaeota archaeon]|nr:hypothetical protein [Candidatus Micrarchaeota archaeon]
MKSVSVGIFHDDGKLLGMLGKKGTASDILFSNRKEGDSFYTFMEPKEGKISAKCEIMQSVDIVIVCIENITADIGETVLMLDALGKECGILLFPDFLENEIKKITKDTVVSSYVVADESFNSLMDAINSFDIKRDANAKTIVEVDHFFNVKGVGTVVLGFVKSGTVKKHDKLRKLPEGKDVLVRSIQMHDKDFDEAQEGCRVGLALRGIDADEFSRGSILCEEGAMAVSEQFEIIFKGNKFYQGELAQGKVMHASSGMRFFPVTIDSVSDEKMTMTTDRKIPIRKGMRIMLIDLNAEKLHLAGSGVVV